MRTNKGELMKQDLIILEEDKQWARRRIAELEQAILDLGPEFYDVFNQSSETWHDNAPFDALRDRQSVLDAELQQLKTVLRSTSPTKLVRRRLAVGIGTVIELKDKKGILQRYKIAGHWTPHAGQIVDGTMIVSLGSPLAIELLGKKIGAATRFGDITSLE